MHITIMRSDEPRLSRHAAVAGRGGRAAARHHCAGVMNGLRRGVWLALEASLP